MPELLVERTAFLPAERTGPAALAAEVARAAASPLVTAVLESADAAAAVLDEHRQVIAFNPAYLTAAGVADPAGALGLRPGEALGCAFAARAGGGCGTTTACPTCGTALALVAAAGGAAAERICALCCERDGVREDREFRARASPLAIDGQRFLLLTLHDVTAEARRAMLERAFLHDLANLAVGLHAAAEELVAGGDAEAPADVRLLSQQLVQQIRLQRLLASGPGDGARPPFRAASLETSDAIALLRRSIERHPAAGGRTVEWPRVPTGLLVAADPALLHHVLLNMALNALEAVPAGARIRVVVEAADGRIRLGVWNPGAIPRAVVPRIFQRYFSTKPGAGRGHGTWAMKLFGEELMGGRVTFTSAERDGTWFELSLPAAVGG